jgi:hypothetical protein
MGNKNVIEVYADYIYYVPIGDKEKIDYIRDTLVAADVEKYVEYLSLKTMIPLACHKEVLERKRCRSIKLDPIVEEAQAHAFAHHDAHDSYMLACLKFIDNSYILTSPRFVMVDGNDPEKGLNKEFSRLSKHKLDAMLANTIKPIAIIGSKKDAILYVSKLTNKRSPPEVNIGNLLKFLEGDDDLK